MKIGFDMLLWTAHVQPEHWDILEDIKKTGYDGAEIPVSMTIVPMRQGERPISNVAFIATALGNVTRDLGIPSARHESHPPRHAPVMSVH